MMTKKERVEAVVAGQQPECAPVSFWHHFAPNEIRGQAAIDAHLQHLEAYDLDFLKVMNDHLFPRGDVNVVETVEDLKKIKPLPGDTGELAGQLDLLRKLHDQLGEDILTCTTLFNPWATLRQMTKPPSDTHRPPKLNGEDERDDKLSELLQTDRAAVKAAIEAITETLTAFAAQCLAAGANGIFLSVRDDWVNCPANGPDTYDDILRPVDLRILEAASAGTFNILHICGRPQNFLAFAEYPVQVINWADRAAGPSIAYARDHVKRTVALAGGVDNLKTLPEGTPEDCADEVRDALRQAKDRPIVIAAGCTFDPTIVPPANLKAVVAAARNQTR